MTIEEAVAMVQKHERARQGRLRAKLMQEIRKQEKTDAKAADRGQKKTSEAMAARKIQSHWRGVVARRQVKKKREDELVFIGMVSAVVIKILSLRNYFVKSIFNDES